MDLSDHEQYRDWALMNNVRNTRISTKTRKVTDEYVTNTFEQIPSWEANGYPASHLEDEISLPAICPYPEPNQHSSHPPFLLLLTYILMLSTHLDLGLSRGFLPSGSTTKLVYAYTSYCSMKLVN